MSTIAVLTSTESGADSLTDINNNFSNLNTDKWEVTSVTGATAITTPANGDLFAILDSTSSYALKKITWANMITTIQASGVLLLDQTTPQTISNDSPIFGSLTASELVATTASKKLQSLSVATYPSLTELSYVKGVTSAIQTQIDAKAPSTSPTFATSITGSYLTASTILIADASKNIISATTATYPSLTELSYLKGVTSAIQTQIDAKYGSGSSPTFATITTTGGIELGNASDTTIARDSAGVVSIEGVVISTATNTLALSNKTLTAPKILDTGYIADDNGNEQIKFSTTTSAVNEFTVKNSATGNAPQLQVTGGDTNIDLKLVPKGSGKVVPVGPVNHGAYTAYFTETDNGNSSTADTIDWNLSNKQKSTLTGNCTFTFTAPAGPCSLILKLVQDGTGSRTVTWPASVHWSGGTAPTLTTTASKVDIITFYYDGSTYFGNYSLNFTA